MSVAEEEPALCLQALGKEGGWLKSGKATALSSSPADLPVFPPHPSQHEAPTRINALTAAPGQRKGPQKLPKPGLRILFRVHTPYPGILLPHRL